LSVLASAGISEFIMPGSTIRECCNLEQLGIE